MQLQAGSMSTKHTHAVHHLSTVHKWNAVHNLWGHQKCKSNVHSPCQKKQSQQKGEKGAAPGIEPGTSRTLSGNHATRPSGRCAGRGPAFKRWALNAGVTCGQCALLPQEGITQPPDLCITLSSGSFKQSPDCKACPGFHTLFIKVKAGFSSLLYGVQAYQSIIFVQRVPANTEASCFLGDD